MKKLIVGLGNPEEKWSKTRHNMGWMCLNRIEGLKWEFLLGTGFIAEDSEGNVYLRPTVGMNNSGLAVRALKEKYGVSLEDILIVVDDMDLPFGNIRLKGKGSSKHNGLRSIEEHLGTSKYVRLKIGIGKNFEPGHQLDYVLGNFTENEALDLPEVLEAGKSAIEVWLEEETLDRAMSKVN